MNFEEFVALVEQLRSTQKSYFKTRSFEVLRASKQLEKEVDQAICNLKEGKKQESLF